jgi:hypothetical protein
MTVVSLFVTSVSAKVASSSEQALRERAEQLYGALQRGDWRQAEKYLTKESKPVFRNLAKKPVTAYEIQSTKLDTNGETAVVVVLIPFPTGFAPLPMRAPQTTHWRLVKGNWYLQLSESHATLPESHATLPALGMTGARPPASSPPQPLRSKDLKFESTRVSAGYVHKGEVKVAVFPFTNVSQHVVTVSVGQTGCDCLRLKTTQKEFKPGEAGVIEFELDPSTLNFDVRQALTISVMLETEPEHAVTELTILAALTPDSAEALPPSSAPPPLPAPRKP